MRSIPIRQPQSLPVTILRRGAASTRRTIALACMLGTTVGCADAHREITGVPAPGESAAIVMGSVAWTGGRVSREETRVDSATRRFQFRWCRGERVGVDCDLNANVSSGDAYEPAVDYLFRLQNTRAFRSLRSAYVTTSEVVPPDPSTAWLDVTANARYRRITWDGRAQIPEIVGKMTCAMLAARGSLILCD